MEMNQMSLFLKELRKERRLTPKQAGITVYHPD